jgi:hypothetical protein
MAGGLILVLAAAAWWLAPRLIRARVGARLSRLHEVTEHREIAVDGRRIRIAGLRLVMGNGRLSIDIDELEARVDPVAVLLGNDAGLEEIQARGVRIRLAGGTPAPATLFTLPQEIHEPSPPPAADSASPRSALSGSGPGRLSALLDELGPGAVLGVERGSVVRETAAGDEEIFESLSALLRRQRPGRFLAEGTSSTAAGGEVRWETELTSSGSMGAGRMVLTDVPLIDVATVVPGIPWHRPEAGRLHGELTWEPEGPGRISLGGRVRLENGGLLSAALAAGPVEAFDLELDGAGLWTAVENRLEVRALQVLTEGVAVQLAGAVEAAAPGFRVDIEARLPVTPCDDLLAAVPAGLLGVTAGFVLDGDIDGEIHARVDTSALNETELRIQVEDGCRTRAVPGALEPARLRGRFFYHVPAADGSWTERESGSGSADWTPAAAVSPFLLHAVLAHEDAAFFRHRGFVTPAIREALVRDLQARRFRQGASTISMQLARNLFLSREKNLARKLQEVILTRWLEETLSKREILELYLNVIEYGPHLHGIRSASRHYFRREPADLSPAESAFLACILPAPHRYHRQVKSGRLPESLARQIGSLLGLMTEAGRIDEVARDHGLAELESGLLAAASPGDPATRRIHGSAAPLGWED